MKTIKVIATAGMIFSCFMVWSQPSDATQRAQMKKMYENSGKKVISINLRGKGSVSREYENGAYVDEYHRRFDVKRTTKYPGVIETRDDGLIYHYVGGKWTFKQLTIGYQGNYEGIPNPDKNTIQKIIDENYVPRNCINMKDQIIEVHGKPKILDNTEWKWGRLNRVGFDASIVVSMLTSTTSLELEKRKYICDMRFERSEDGVNYDRDADLLLDGKWLPGCNCYISGDDYELIEKRTLTKEERKEMKTIEYREREDAAQAIIDALPEIEIPEFKSHNHVIQYTHELLREGDANKMKAYMFKMIPKSKNFSEDLPIELTNTGKGLVNGALKNIEHYADGYCQYPLIYHQQTGMVQFYDKNKHSFNRINVSYQNDRYYVTHVGYGKIDVKPGNEDNCGDPIIFTSEPEYGVGDKVEVIEGSTWYPADIVKVNEDKGNYTCKFRNGTTEPVYPSRIRLIRKKGAAPKYKVGDQVLANYNGTWYEAEIVEFSDEKSEYKVKYYTDGKFSWLTPNNIKINENTSSKANVKSESKKETVTSANEDEEDKKDKKKSSGKTKKKLKGLKNKIKIPN